MTKAPVPSLYSLRFRESELLVELDAGLSVNIAIEFLSTHFSWTRIENVGTSEPIATLRLHALPFEPDIWLDARHWSEIYVRKSASDFFTIPARKATVAGIELIECTRTGTRMIFDRASGAIDVGLASAGAMDLVELIRDLVLKDQENRGAVVLHAAAAHRPNETVIVSGSKGAGKSTILLELVEHFGFQVLSGDKTLAREAPDGRVVVVGWPDYPHLGFGTIDKYEGLKEVAGIGANYTPDDAHVFSPYGKFAVDPDGFRRRFASAPAGTQSAVTHVLQPSIGPGKTTELARVDSSASERADYLRGNIESGFAGKYADWQTYSLDESKLHAERTGRILAALGEIDAWRVTGPGDLEGHQFPPSAVDARVANS